MTHYRVLPFLPQIPTDTDLDKHPLTLSVVPESMPDAASASWLIPLLIMAIAAVCLWLVVFN